MSVSPLSFCLSRSRILLSLFLVSLFLTLSPQSVFDSCSFSCYLSPSLLLSHSLILSLSQSLIFSYSYSLRSHSLILSLPPYSLCLTLHVILDLKLLGLSYSVLGLALRLQQASKEKQQQHAPRLRQRVNNQLWDGTAHKVRATTCWRRWASPSSACCKSATRRSCSVCTPHVTL